MNPTRGCSYVFTPGGWRKPAPTSSGVYATRLYLAEKAVRELTAERDALRRLLRDIADGAGKALEEI